MPFMSTAVTRLQFHLNACKRMLEHCSVYMQAADAVCSMCYQLTAWSKWSCVLKCTGLMTPHRQPKGMSIHYTPCVKYHVAVCFGAPGVLEHVWKFGSL